MSDDTNQPKPDANTVVTPPPPPVATMPSPAYAVKGSPKPMIPMLSMEQIQSLAMSAQRSQALEEQVAQLSRQLTALQARSGQVTGKIIRVHCNLCGKDANTDGTPSCGHNDFINHLVAGDTILQDGNVAPRIQRQTRVF